MLKSEQTNIVPTIIELCTDYLVNGRKLKSVSF